MLPLPSQMSLQAGEQAHIGNSRLHNAVLQTDSKAVPQAVVPSACSREPCSAAHVQHHVEPHATGSLSNTRRQVGQATLVPLKNV